MKATRACPHVQEPQKLGRVGIASLRPVGWYGNICFSWPSTGGHMAVLGCRFPHNRGQEGEKEREILKYVPVVSVVHGTTLLAAALAVCAFAAIFGRMGRPPLPIPRSFLGRESLGNSVGTFEELLFARATLCARPSYLLCGGLIHASASPVCPGPCPQCPVALRPSSCLSNGDRCHPWLLRAFRVCCGGDPAHWY